MISTWTKKAGLMDFETIDNIKGSHVYSLAWRFTDVPDDPWSARLNAFKNNDPKAIEAACFVMSYAISEINWGKRKFVLVSAIPSGKTDLPKDCGLFCLGNKIASTVRWEWKPDVLTKQIHRKLHSIPSASDRDEEVSHKYLAKGTIEADYICILDDMVTRGSTMAEIARAVKVVNSSARIVGFALGKTEKQGYAKSNGYDINNDHIPSEYADVWDNIWKSK